VAICCFAIVLLTSVPATAGVIESITSGAAFINASFYAGQSFTTPAGGPWGNITFNFFSDASPATTPNAIGTAYLLSQVFAGTPAALSPAAPGFIATDTSIVGNVYVFDPSVMLQPNTQYFLYSNALFPGGSVTGGPAGSGLYVTVSSDSSFTPGAGTFNFALDGTAAPEPGSLSLLSLGMLAGLCKFVRRKAR
jgi:hypothetical protein